MAMTLTKLLGGWDVTGLSPVAGLTSDSRAVKKGFIFFALKGVHTDGRDYIIDAFNQGAIAAITDQTDPTDYGPEKLVIKVHNPRRKYAELVARFYASQPKVQVAITGTNGKTSTAEFTRQFWAANGLNAASLGTLGVISDTIVRPGGLTTPDPSVLHSYLAELAHAGVEYAAIEASSHGLDQHRLDGVRLKAAAFTNLSRDHLDYHMTEQNYFYAKARLFGELLLPGDTAVINRDCKWGRVLEDVAWGRGIHILSVGRCEHAKLRLLEQKVSPQGQEITFSFQGKLYHSPLPLIGDFQAENVLLALGLAIATGVSIDDCVASMPTLKGAPGRMEHMGNTLSGGSIYVDYAHTPHGLESVLKAAKEHKPARLHVVFGSGGDRDKGKRPLMGQVADKYAHCITITDDNPRSEDAATIRSEILMACMHGKEIGDRYTAIETAIDGLQKGDMLIIAGKGHEEGQLIKGITHPFSDIKTVQKLLRADVARSNPHNAAQGESSLGGPHV